MKKLLGNMSLTTMGVITFLLIAVWLVLNNVIVESQPATTAQITAGIASARPECRALVQARVTGRIVESGAISKRQLDIMLHQECLVAGAQYKAATGG